MDRSWQSAVCRLSGLTWVGVQVFGVLVCAAMVYVILDAQMPAARVLRTPVVTTQPLVAGRGFRIEYAIEKRRQCPGRIEHFLVAQAGDHVVIPITREPVGTFRRVGDPPVFAMQPYVPRYVEPGQYVVRTAVSYECGSGRQQLVFDSAAVDVVGRDVR